MEPFLDPKTQLLVALGAAMAAKCRQCFAKLYATRDALGVTDHEIRAALAIATKVAGKAHEFMAAFVEETMGGAVAAAPQSGTGCGCS